MRQVSHPATWQGWRAEARACMVRNEAPETITFCGDDAPQTSLFAAAPASPPVPRGRGPSIPRDFIAMAQEVAAHNDPSRWDLMYRLLWRYNHGEPHVMELSTDDDVLRFTRMARAVARDIHKTHAYVRFRAVADDSAPEGKHWVAWYAPEHRVLPLAIDHFVKRFANMHWTLMTAHASVTHRDGKLIWGPGQPRHAAPEKDDLEDLWRVYYANIFNPARLNVRAMTQEMPRRYWHTMPETTLIDGLVKEASMRTEEFIKAQPQKAPAAPSYTSWKALEHDAKQCTVCTWCSNSTQVVMGEGKHTAPLMFIGEQPGDQEDLQGKPFVGPAGQLFDEALADAGIDRGEAYVTNAVKHFKWEPRGKRRLHQKPNAGDVAACKPWLAAEVKLLEPKVLVCLGTTAALAVMGKATKLKDVRGQELETAACAHTFVTTHPSAILRTPPEAREAAYAAFVEDLKRVNAALR